MKRFYMLTITCFFFIQVQAQTPTPTTQEVLVITKALIASPVTQKSIPTTALPKGKVEFSVRQFYARKVLQTQGDVRLPAGEKKIFRAGEAILLEPGFEVDSTVEFTAEIGGPEAIINESVMRATQVPDTLNNVLQETRTAVQSEMEESPAVAFTVFPNPVSERLYVRYHLTEEAPVAVTLFSMNGAAIKTLRNLEEQAAGAYELEFKVSNIQAGMYLVLLKLGKLTSTQHIVIQ
jgi:hypothetical protein